MRFRAVKTMRRGVREPRDLAETNLSGLIALSYELLDAHADTARLAADDATEGEWRSHLAYLRDLQRAGREVLARSAAPVRG